jgi:hypothetical protein
MTKQSLSGVGRSSLFIILEAGSQKVGEGADGAIHFHSPVIGFKVN